LSSITERSRERGQTLPLFALAIVVLLGFAALAFDGGQMLLDRRTEQNTADAAALAGARYVPTSAAQARDEAMRIAYQNGFGAGPTFASSGVTATDGTVVTVKVPPGPESEFAGQAGYVEVQVGNTRPSIFGGVLGILNQRTGALATAANKLGAAANYSMIALDPDACMSAKFTGNATITVGGNIQVDSSSTCPQGAFNAVGNTEVTVSAPNGSIDVVGNARCQGSAICVPDASEGQPYLPDPLGLPPPGLPSLPADLAPILNPDGLDIPDGCPGGATAATAEEPATCAFTSNYAGSVWVLSAGYYPGGISVLAGTIFMKPGLYYIGGGGFTASGLDANLYSVSDAWALDTAPTTCTPTSFADCGGVLIYNTNDPSATSGATSVTDMQAILLNGSDSDINLYPIQNAGPYTNIVIFQDPSLPSDPSGDLVLNGSGSNLYVQGTVYLPAGSVKVNGEGDLGPFQIIANDFAISGSGNLSVAYNQDLVAQLIAVGLVE